VWNHAGCPVQTSLGRRFSSAEHIRTVGKMPSCSRRRAVRCDSISTVPVSPNRGLAQPSSNTARDAPPVAVSRVGCCELSLACSSVTAKSSRSCYIVSMPTNLHRYYCSGYSHFITQVVINAVPSSGRPALAISRSGYGAASDITPMASPARF
jgi:hypothetical protein